MTERPYTPEQMRELRERYVAACDAHDEAGTDESFRQMDEACHTLWSADTAVRLYLDDDPAIAKFRAVLAEQKAKINKIRAEMEALIDAEVKPYQLVERELSSLMHLIIYGEDP